MEAREEAVRLPNKINNQGTVPTLQRVSVLLNAYQMDLKQTINEVYQFEVRFVGERIARRKGQEQTVQQDFSRGPRNDEAKETRRRLLWQLFQQLLAQNPDFFGNEKRIFTYDCALLLFCTNDLRMAINQNRQFIVNVDRTALEPRCNSYIRNTERITANLVRTGTIDLKNAATAYIQGDRSVVHFLELLTSQRMFEQGQHYCFGNRMYEQEDVIPLGGGRGQNDPRILKRGMQKNVRFVGDNMRNAQPIVQIDPKKSAFFPNMGLLEFIGRFLECANPQQMERNFQNYFNKANKQIRGLVLETTHLPQNQVTFSTVGLTTQSANEITFEREGQRVSVAQHFQDTYQLALRYPRLPCVIHRMPQKRESYFPIEYVRIVQGQRIPIDKQTPNLTEQMIRQCQVLPENLAAQIDEQRDKGMIQSGNPFFRAHNVRVDTNLIKSEGALLFPPAIQYEPPGDVVEPDQRGGMRWSMIGGGTQRRQYPIPAKWPKPWAVVIMQNAVGMDQCRTFCQRMVENARQRGLADANMPQRVDQFEDTSLEFMNEKFEFFSQHSCMFVLFFAPGKRNAHPGDIHHIMKLMEQRHNVLTQHISPEIMNKGAGQGGGAAMVVENILFKTNLKLGGANYHLVTSNLFKQANRNQQDILGNIWLSGNRMFFGIAMSHAPPQSLYERQAGKAAAIPTVVGMAYTIGKAMLQMRGTYWMQQPRLTTMSDEHRRPFINAIRNALQIYESNNGKYPEHVIVYRGGASEGEFKRVCYWEGAAFIEAFREIRNQNRAFQPPAVTIIVCQRQSNYRIIPERVQRGAKAPDQNVQPGTIVDKGAMNAALTEFLLVAHKALQGTAQPVRCTIIYEWRPDEGPAANIQKQIPLEEIENMTNALCYSHGICCMSTAVPGVLYSADELAKRGRNNWKMHSGDGETVPQFDLPPLGEGHEQAQQQLNEQRAAYFADISERLNPRIPTKFWA